MSVILYKACKCKGWGEASESFQGKLLLKTIRGNRSHWNFTVISGYSFAQISRHIHIFFYLFLSYIKDGILGFYCCTKMTTNFSGFEQHKSIILISLDLRVGPGLHGPSTQVARIQFLLSSLVVAEFNSCDCRPEALISYNLPTIPCHMVLSTIRSLPL